MADSADDGGVTARELSYEHPIVLFDGVCNLCNSVVQFIIRRDPDGTFRFASLQSSTGQELLRACGLAPDQRETFVVVKDGDAYTKSRAAIEVAADLGGVYGLARLLRVVPRTLRDACYDVVAANRKRVFGERDQCMLPTPDRESRFLTQRD